METQTTYTTRLHGSDGPLADITTELATPDEAYANARKVAVEQHSDAVVIDLYAKTTRGTTLVSYQRIGTAWV